MKVSATGVQISHTQQTPLLGPAFFLLLFLHLSDFLLLLHLLEEIELETLFSGGIIRLWGEDVSGIQCGQGSLARRCFT